MRLAWLAAALQALRHLQHLQHLQQLPRLQRLRRLLWAAWATVLATHGAVAQPALQLLAPVGDATVTRATAINILGRTDRAATVRVAGEPVAVYGTGVFVRDQLPLALGRNELTVEVSGSDGATVRHTVVVQRLPPPAPPSWPARRLWLDGGSLEPSQDHRLAPGEDVEVALRATPGQKVQARLAGHRWQTLAEPQPGQYRGWLRFTASDDVAPAAVQVRLLGSGPLRKARPARLAARTAGTVGQWRNDAARLYVAGPEGAGLLHGLHEVRLGGPFLAEVPAGTLLAVDGARGDKLRVRLAPDTVGWVAASAVAPAAPGTQAPRASFTSLSVSSEAEGDVVQIPLPDTVPVAVTAVADGPAQALVLDIFGAHHATTWITQRHDTREVRAVRVEQAAAGRVRVSVAPHSSRLWGWRVERTPTALRLHLRAAPVAADPARPLSGLRVALEPGHGSADNLGAVGATGTPEKDINRWTVEALRAELEAQGAQVVVVREGDDNPSLRLRSERAEASGAQLFVSVHANAADTTRGHLRVGGTSTYFKHAHGRDLAAAVQGRLLAQTGLADFGLVGNFNYAPIRWVTWMPAVLVEQAFVTNPRDEAQLLDPAFRSLMARSIREGLEDFLRAPR
jgi:N-acetylmuramoyl-L-alanine amidase